MMLISISISPAIQSVMARGRDDLVGFASTHRNIESKLFLLGCVLSLLFFVNSELIVLIMFGKEWIYVSDILSIFSIAIPFLLLQGISGGFFQALNNTDLLFYLGILSLILNLTAIMIGVYFRSVNYLSYSL
ncbi:MATE family efflux transporter, partial [Vibrio campbellii]|uniref:MATE family efflux transporter n=1 Tax=Vibrio campbellii TaxID=680 RepID=UPI0018C2846F